MSKARSFKLVSARNGRYGTFVLALAFALTVSLGAFASSASAFPLNFGSESSNDSSATVEETEGEAHLDSSTSTTTTTDSESESTTSSEANLEGDATLSNEGGSGSTSANASTRAEGEADADSATNGSGESSIDMNAAAPADIEGEGGFDLGLFLQSNVLTLLAEPVELDEGDVEVKTADSSEANFENDFTYYVVHHDQEYESAIYREPARLGGENVELSGSTVGSFWLGVSAPDENGIQSEINHQGMVTLYMETEDGWKSLEAQFDGEGELQSVNGVSLTE